MSQFIIFIMYFTPNAFKHHISVAFMVTLPLHFIAACAFIKWLASLYAVLPTTLPGDYENNSRRAVEPAAIYITRNTAHFFFLLTLWRAAAVIQAHIYLKLREHTSNSQVFTCLHALVTQTLALTVSNCF